jgi:hypothetical protein
VSECAGSIHVLAARATRLLADGTPDEGSTGSYVTENPMRVAVNPEIEQGEDRTQKNGADCPCLTYKVPDYVKRWNLELDNCRLEPGLFELLFGAEVIPGSTPGSIVGNILPSGVANCDLSTLGVALEFWTRAWDGDRQNPDFPYIRWVIPKSIWQLGDHEFNAEFLTVSMTGFSENNPGFTDPYGDAPAEYDNPDGKVAWYYDTAVPEGACGYAVLGSGS